MRNLPILLPPPPRERESGPPDFRGVTPSQKSRGWGTNMGKPPRKRCGDTFACAKTNTFSHYNTLVLAIGQGDQKLSMSCIACCSTGNWCPRSRPTNRPYSYFLIGTTVPTSHGNESLSFIQGDQNSIDWMPKVRTSLESSLGHLSRIVLFCTF